MPKVFRVALDTPLRRLFDYLPPAPGEIGAIPSPGARVRVPFGRQRLIGLIVEIAAHSELPAERLKPILEVLDPTPIADAGVLGLCGWAAQYYHHPIGEVLASALPKALRQGASAMANEERWSASAAGVESHSSGEPRRAPRQRALLELLCAEGPATPATLDARFDRGARPPGPSPPGAGSQASKSRVTHPRKVPAPARRDRSFLPNNTPRSRRLPSSWELFAPSCSMA